MLVRWFRYQYPKLLLFAIPNGSVRGGNKIQGILVGRKLKEEGVVAGVPDLFMPAANRDHNGLFIEMKVKPNKPTTEQSEMQDRLIDLGYAASICYSYEEAKKEINHYLNDL